MPRWTHFPSSRTEMLFLKVMAHCLQYSTQVPHPVQSPGVRSGRIRPMIPMSFKSGLLQQDMAMRSRTGNFLSKTRHHYLSPSTVSGSPNDSIWF